MNKTTAVGTWLFAAIAFCFCPQSHAQTDITLDLTLELDSIGPIGAFESPILFATLTNTSATETLPLLPFTVTITQSSDSYQIDNFFNGFSSVSLPPGESIAFEFATLTPLSPPVPSGSYEVYGDFSFGESLASPIQASASSAVLFTVVPEPAPLHLLMFAACAIVCGSRRRRR